MKKISLLLAILMSLTIAATGCEDKDISQDPVQTTISLPEPETTAPITTEETTVETTEATSEETTTAATTAATTVATTKATTAKTTVATTVEATTAVATTPAVSATVTVNVNNNAKMGNFVYNTLSADEKVLYDEIFAAVKDFKSEVTFSKSYDASTVTKVYEDVYFQEPALFWFRGEQKSLSGSVNSLTLSYWCSQADAATYQKNIDASVNNILAKIPNGASDTQKLKVIHDNVVLKASFQKDTNFNTTTIYGPLVAGPTQCEGYAKVVSYLCAKAGVESVRITGHNKEGLTHAWNKVVVGGKWYNFDTTWDDPQGNTNPNYFTYNYFLVPDAQVNNISHFPNTSFTAPKANSLDANHHVVNGMYATTKDQAVKILKEQLINAAKTKSPIASIKCSTKAVFDETYNYLIKQAGLFTVLDDANNSSANKIAKDKTKFTKDESLFVINIKPAY